jgi:hypothetical protein
LSISQSIIQGSGIGPILYIIFASDLKTVSDNNKICNYSDDTTLMVGELSDVNFETEFNNITEWAAGSRCRGRATNHAGVRPVPESDHAGVRPDWNVWNVEGGCGVNSKRSQIGQSA